MRITRLTPAAEQFDPDDQDYQASIARAIADTMTERFVIEQRFGVRFDPSGDGQLLMEKRTQ